MHPWPGSVEPLPCRENAVDGIHGQEQRKKAAYTAAFSHRPLRKGSPIGSIVATTAQNRCSPGFGSVRLRDIPSRSTFYLFANKRPNLGKAISKKLRVN